MPFKPKEFCLNKKSFQDLVVFVSLALQHFEVFAWNVNALFLKKHLLFESLSTCLYLRLSCLASLCNNLVTSNFITCKQPELVLVILHA